MTPIDAQLKRIKAIGDLLNPGESATINLTRDPNKVKLDEARNTIAKLLKRIDNLCGPDLHCLGETPSWYIEAAAISAGMTPRSHTR